MLMMIKYAIVRKYLIIIISMIRLIKIYSCQVINNRMNKNSNVLLDRIKSV